ncbi:hypothetical protein OAI75_01775 [Woeseiaceae bacterium]|nr:hypothetical protein [Woeseiaceae bacterium]
MPTPMKLFAIAMLAFVLSPVMAVGQAHPCLEELLRDAEAALKRVCDENNTHTTF